MNRLKELRKEQGLTLDEIQSKTGINRGTYNNYESGKTEPNKKTWQALADYFDVSVPYLQGKIFKEDLSPELQDMFDDIQDLVTLIVPDYAVERVLTTLINSHKYNYSNDGWD